MLSEKALNRNGDVFICKLRDFLLFIGSFINRFSPSFLIFILTSMPSLWLLEMRRVAQRRLVDSGHHNDTHTEFFDQFILRIGNDEFDPSQTLPHNIFAKTV